MAGPELTLALRFRLSRREAVRCAPSPAKGLPDWEVALRPSSNRASPVDMASLAPATSLTASFAVLAASGRDESLTVAAVRTANAAVAAMRSKFRTSRSSSAGARFAAGKAPLAACREPRGAFPRSPCLAEPAAAIARLRNFRARHPAPRSFEGVGVGGLRASRGEK